MLLYVFNIFDYVPTLIGDVLSVIPDDLITQWVDCQPVFLKA